MNFSQELPKGVETFLLDVSMEHLLTLQDLIPLLSSLENEKHKPSVEDNLNRWLANDAEYNVFDGSYYEGFGEWVEDYYQVPLARRTALPFNRAQVHGFDFYFNADHRYYCNRSEIEMGILSRPESDALTLPLDLEWDFSSSSVSFLEYHVSFFKEKLVKFIIVRNIVHSLELKHEEMLKSLVDGQSHVRLRMSMLKEVRRRRSTLRSRKGSNPQSADHSYIQTYKDLKNHHKQEYKKYVGIQNRQRYLWRLVRDADGAQSCLLSPLMSLIRRLRFARERLILTKPWREIHLPAEVWSNILENVMPNIQTINYSNGKLGRMLERWMISKVLFQTAVSLYYKEAIFLFTPDSFMLCPAVKMMKKITIDICSRQWHEHTIGTECTCNLPKTATAIEAYNLQKQLKECTALVELRFIIQPCARIGDRTAGPGNCVSLSKDDLFDLQRWKGPCDCCIFSKKSALCSLPTLVPVEIV
ncbi:hypothetical protein OCU04_009818 [Sclerotinia nivalis]|uniref:Uncharacterized protein n=1 Tax=Sclerotinia nivalis TaxID=352851 RepID=A0A9X0AJD1_9HELO|nr:hypothetical protein OCU04_009818 [Sclerotinia nivalis]